MKHLSHTSDICIVGGGISGMCAAVAAARHGARVILINDRPVLGGNASSEVRMWFSGAHGENMRETGLVEEINLENNYRNPSSNFSIWDSVMYEFVKYAPNVELFLNCSVNDAQMNDDGTIRSVKGWQGTAETWHTFSADLFLDCSGDSILSTLTGAEYRIGREARAEFGEDIEPEEADRKTMGMSCLLQARETDHPVTYIPPKWARVFKSPNELPNRHIGFKGLNNFWWIELGGEDDSIHDTEAMRDRLLPIAFGVWDHIKNHGSYGADNWELEWVGFLPGKRESRRYIGAHILTQNEVRAEGRFDDLIAYGGWTMDDHNPGGFDYPGQPTIFHPAPSPYGIPYRCLYSRNIKNLMFAGRNVSVTHAAMSSTRVMFTCATLGQAAGTAAAIAIREKCTPAGVYEHHIAELRQTLADDDSYLPWFTRAIPEISRQAHLTASEGDPEPLRNGIDRPTKDASGAWNDNSWAGAPGSWIQYEFDAPTHVTLARFTFDSDLNRKGKGDASTHWEKNILSNYPLHQPPRTVPPTIVKSFRIESRCEDDTWQTIVRAENNYQRLVKVPLDATTTAIRFVPESTWGADICKLFAFEVK